MRALIVGYGKMGRAVEAALLLHGHSIFGRLDRGDSVASIDPSAVDVAFEFTAPGSAPELVASLVTRGVAVVSGTTGWDPAHARKLANEKGVLFLHAPNFSIGVAAMRRAASLLAAFLAPFPEFEPGLVERHHSAKKDAPSGTARLLAAAVEEARPHGSPLPVISLRHGGQPGEHVLIFEGADEALELVHRARSRAIFASGAVRAAEWLVTSGRRGSVSFDDFLAAVITSSERRSP